MMRIIRESRTVCLLVAIFAAGGCGEDRGGQPTHAKKTIASPKKSPLQADAARVYYTDEFKRDGIRTLRWKLELGDDIKKVSYGLQGTAGSGQISSAQELLETDPRVRELSFRISEISGDQVLAFLALSKDPRAKPLVDEPTEEFKKGKISLFELSLHNSKLWGIIPGSAIFGAPTMSLSSHHRGGEEGKPSLHRIGNAMVLAKFITGDLNRSLSHSSQAGKVILRVDGEEVDFAGYEMPGWYFWLRFDG